VDDPCPPPERLAGYVEGRLLDRERAAVEAHGADCAACRAALVGLLAEPAGKVLRPRRWIPIAAAAAAVLLAALCLVPRRGDTATGLEAAALDLAEARPDLFRGFRPVGPADPLPPSLAQRRGALAQFAPAGRILDPRPRFRWEGVPGVARWRVALLTDEGDPIWEADAEGADLAYPSGRPDLDPGRRYLWDVSGEGPLGPAGGRRAFDVASTEERDRFAEASREIDRLAPARLRPLLRAHLALRRGLYAAAEEEAAAFVAAEPADAAGRDALDAARRALGRAPSEGEGR
jgi:hypothetical protein